MATTNYQLNGGGNNSEDTKKFTKRLLVAEEARIRSVERSCRFYSGVWPLLLRAQPSVAGSDCYSHPTYGTNNNISLGRVRIELFLCIAEFRELPPIHSSLHRVMAWLLSVGRTVL